MRVLAFLVALTACSFSDPKLDDTQFRCDGDGKCPAGQLCKGGTCVVGTHDGIACTTPCAAGEQCCNDNTNPPRCIAGTAACLGTSAFCDGREDCISGSYCCRGGTQQRCAPEDECLQAACQDASDCPSTSPNCCASTDDPQPWKFCSFAPC